MLRFEKPDINKQKEKERIEEASKAAFDAAVGAAQNCLNSEEFRKYREEYEKLEKLLIEELMLLDQTEFEPIQYGFKCKDIVTQIRHVGILLKGVKSDAGRKNS